MSGFLRCPHCGGELYLTYYIAVIKILKDRSWYACRRCRFSEEVEKFKARMLCV